MQENVPFWPESMIALLVVMLVYPQSSGLKWAPAAAIPAAKANLMLAMYRVFG